MSFSTRLRRMINLNFELIEANDTKKAHMCALFCYVDYPLFRADCHIFNLIKHF